MGCVLGTRAAGERASRRKKKIEGHRNSETVTVTLPNGSVERGKKIEDAIAAATAAPEFRLKRGVSTGAEGWPSWLNDVAGHAIKDWKPRRANTFEKLDKVTAVISKSFISAFRKSFISTFFYSINAWEKGTSVH